MEGELEVKGMKSVRQFGYYCNGPSEQRFRDSNVKKEVICHTCREKLYNLGELNLRIYRKEEIKESLETPSFGS